MNETPKRPNAYKRAADRLAAYRRLLIEIDERFGPFPPLEDVDPEIVIDFACAAFAHAWDPTNPPKLSHERLLDAREALRAAAATLKR